MLPGPEGVKPQMQRASVPASTLPQVTLPAGANAPPDTKAIVVAPVASPSLPKAKLLSLQRFMLPFLFCLDKLLMTVILNLVMETKKQLVVNLLQL